LGFKKERIKRGEKRKRKNIFSGDFDVFASCPSGNPHTNSLVAAKKQWKKNPPPTRKIVSLLRLQPSVSAPCAQSQFLPLKLS
jgi:hypothetical protein